MIPIIVTGEMRSGTTFLANFLNSQENAAVYSDFLRSILAGLDSLKVNSPTSSLSDRAKNVLVSSLLAEGTLHGIDLKPFIKRDNISDWNSLFYMALNALAKLEGLSGSDETLIGVKRTLEVDFLNELMDDGVKIIYIYRDPRDVMYSSKNRFSEYQELQFIHRYKTAMEKARGYSAHKNFLFLKFEDLILEKEKTVGIISGFLGFPLSLGMDSFKMRKDRTYNDNSSFGDVNTLFDTSAAYRWKKIEPKETMRTEVLCKGLIENLGYETRDVDKSYARNHQKKFSSYLRKIKLKRFLRKLVK